MSISERQKQICCFFPHNHWTVTGRFPMQRKRRTTPAGSCCRRQERRCSCATGPNLEPEVRFGSAVWKNWIMLSLMYRIPSYPHHVHSCKTRLDPISGQAVFRFAVRAYCSREARTSVILADGSPLVAVTVTRIFSATRAANRCVHFLIKLPQMSATFVHADPSNTSTV